MHKGNIDEIGQVTNCVRWVDLEKNADRDASFVLPELQSTSDITPVWLEANEPLTRDIITIWFAGAAVKGR